VWHSWQSCPDGGGAYCWADSGGLRLPAAEPFLQGGCVLLVEGRRIVNGDENIGVNS
jgi:hypothetical protein